MSLAIEGARYVAHTRQAVDRIADIMRSRVEFGPISVGISAWIPPKTRRQRDYFHAMVRECADHLRADERVLKEDIKSQLGVVEVAPSLVTGDRVARIVPTELYSREQYTALLHAVEAWAASRQIPVTPPDYHDVADQLARARR